jgi:hypothetical protein
MKIIEAWRKLMALFADDKKITNDEIPEFLACLAEIALGVFELVSPFLTGGAAATAKKISDGLNLASKR